MLSKFHKSSEQYRRFYYERGTVSAEHRSDFIRFCQQRGIDLQKVDEYYQNSQINASQFQDRIVMGNEVTWESLARQGIYLNDIDLEPKFPPDTSATHQRMNMVPELQNSGLQVARAVLDCVESGLDQQKVQILEKQSKVIETFVPMNLLIKPALESGTVFVPEAELIRDKCDRLMHLVPHALYALGFRPLRDETGTIDCRFGKLRGERTSLFDSMISNFENEQRSSDQLFEAPGVPITKQSGMPFVSGTSLESKVVNFCCHVSMADALLNNFNNPRELYDALLYTNSKAPFIIGRRDQNNPKQKATIITSVGFDMQNDFNDFLYTVSSTKVRTIYMSPKWLIGPSVKLVHMLATMFKMSPYNGYGFDRAEAIFRETKGNTKKSHFISLNTDYTSFDRTQSIWLPFYVLSYFTPACNEKAFLLAQIHGRTIYKHGRQIAVVENDHLPSGVAPTSISNSLVNLAMAFLGFCSQKGLDVYALGDELNSRKKDFDFLGVPRFDERSLSILYGYVRRFEEQVRVITQGDDRLFLFDSSIRGNTIESFIESDKHMPFIVKHEEPRFECTFLKRNVGWTEREFGPFKKDSFYSVPDLGSVIPSRVYGERTKQGVVPGGLSHISFVSSFKGFKGVSDHVRRYSDLCTDYRCIGDASSDWRNYFETLSEEDINSGPFSTMINEYATNDIGAMYEVMKTMIFSSNTPSSIKEVLDKKFTMGSTLNGPLIVRARDTLIKMAIKSRRQDQLSGMSMIDKMINDLYTVRNKFLTESKQT